MAKGNLCIIFFPTNGHAEMGDEDYGDDDDDDDGDDEDNDHDLQEQGVSRGNKSSFSGLPCTFS